MSSREARRIGLHGDGKMVPASKSLTLRYLALRTAAFLALTAGTTAMMALPYLA